MYNFRNSEPVLEADRRKKSQREKRRKERLHNRAVASPPPVSSRLPNLHSRQTFPSDIRPDLGQNEQDQPSRQRRSHQSLPSPTSSSSDIATDSKQADEIRNGSISPPLRLNQISGPRKSSTSSNHPSTLRSQRSTSHTQRSMASVYSQLSHFSQLSMIPSIAQIADAATSTKQKQKDGSALFPVLAAMNGQDLYALERWLSESQKLMIGNKSKQTATEYSDTGRGLLRSALARLFSLLDHFPHQTRIIGKIVLGYEDMCETLIDDREHKSLKEIEVLQSKVASLEEALQARKKHVKLLEQKQQLWMSQIDDFSSHMKNTENELEVYRKFVYVKTGETNLLAKSGSEKQQKPSELDTDDETKPRGAPQLASLMGEDFNLSLRKMTGETEFKTKWDQQREDEEVQTAQAEIKNTLMATLDEIDKRAEARTNLIDDFDGVTEEGTYLMDMISKTLEQDISSSENQLSRSYTGVLAFFEAKSRTRKSSSVQTMQSFLQDSVREAEEARKASAEAQQEPGHPAAARGDRGRSQTKTTDKKGVHDSEQFTVEQKEKKKAYLGMLIPPPLRALIGELHESGISELGQSLTKPEAINFMLEVFDAKTKHNKKRDAQHRPRMPFCEFLWSHTLETHQSPMQAKNFVKDLITLIRQELEAIHLKESERERKAQRYLENGGGFRRDEEIDASDRVKLLGRWDRRRARKTLREDNTFKWFGYFCGGVFEKDSLPHPSQMGPIAAEVFCDTLQAIRSCKAFSSIQDGEKDDAKEESVYQSELVSRENAKAAKVLKKEQAQKVDDDDEIGFSSDFTESDEEDEEDEDYIPELAVMTSAERDQMRLVNTIDGRDLSQVWRSIEHWFSFNSNRNTRGARGASASGLADFGNQWRNNLEIEDEEERRDEFLDHLSKSARILIRTKDHEEPITLIEPGQSTDENSGRAPEVDELFDSSQHQAWLLNADILLNLFTDEFVSQSSMAKALFKSAFEAVDVKKQGNFSFTDFHSLTSMLLASKKESEGNYSSCRDLYALALASDPERNRITDKGFISALGSITHLCFEGATELCRVFTYAWNCLDYQGHFKFLASYSSSLASIKMKKGGAKKRRAREMNSIKTELSKMQQLETAFLGCSQEMRMDEMEQVYWQMVRLIQNSPFAGRVLPTAAPPTVASKSKV